MTVLRSPAILVGLCFLVAVACSDGTKSQTIASPTGAPPTATSRATPTSLLTPQAYRACRADDVLASAFYQGGGGSMRGGIVFTNASPDPCQLQGWPGVNLRDGDGNALSVGNGGPGRRDAPAVALLPGQKAWVPIVWSNWCPPDVGPTSAGGSIPGGVILFVELPDDGGELTVPVTDPAGEPEAGAPRCDQPWVDSTIGVLEFRPRDP